MRDAPVREILPAIAAAPEGEEILADYASIGAHPAQASAGTVAAETGQDEFAFGNGAG